MLAQGIGYTLETFFLFQKRTLAPDSTNAVALANIVLNDGKTRNLLFLLFLFQFFMS